MRRARTASVAAAAALAAAAGTLATAVPAALAQPRGSAAPARPAQPKPFFDSRSGERRAVARSGRQSLVAPRAATRAARTRVRGALDVDSLTGTPRALGGVAAPLTGPSAGDPRDIAMRDVREHLALLGLTETDLGTLRLQARAPGAGGTVAVRFSQIAGGIPAFDNSLQVVVARDGSVVRVLGAPQHDLSLDSAKPLVTAPEAMRRLRENVGARGTLRVRRGPEGVTREHEFADGDTAELVAFGEGDATRLGWKLSTRGPGHAWYAAVVDARTGKLLYRSNRTRSADEASVWEQYPGAPRGGAAATKSLTPYLNPGATTLSGPYARLWSDLDDDDAVDAPAEEIPRNAGNTFAYAFDEFTAAENPNGGCSSSHKCSWNFETANSWQTNRRQNGVQTFYYVNRFRDHLVAPPISFSSADGNFESADRLVVNTDDGANTGGGRPDADHADNAFMSTPPDGQAPLMGMFLFGQSLDFREVNGGDDAAVVYHEYTHGLSSRLVTNASGEQALDEEQAGSMGEGWSDWYAKDFLVDQFPADDTSAPGEVDMGTYVDNTPHSIRTQALDCPVGTTTNCPGTTAQGQGGYTYGDFNKVSIDPFTDVHEVHQGGEIWAETLWDVRAAVGSAVAQQVLTEGMRNFTPPQPSMLDARDGIIAADRTIFGQGAHTAALWQAFARRGMGTEADDGVVPDPVPDVVTQGFNRPPTVSLSAPAVVAVGAPIEFDASRTTDPDGTVASYGWDFDGNGSIDRTTSASKTTFAYPTGGRRTVRVTATDNDGGKESDTVSVLVSGPTSPTPTPTPTPTVTPGPVNPAAPVVTISRRGSHGRLRFTVKCDSACSGTARLSISRTLARKLGLGLGRKHTIATRRVRLLKAGKKRYTVRLSRKVVRAMRREHVRRISTKLRVNVRDAEQQTGRRSRSPRIRR